MRSAKLLLILLSILFSANTTHAQIWKRLKKKAKEAAERTLERKVEEKTEKETEKAFDSVFNNENDKKILRKRKRKNRRKKKERNNEEQPTTEEVNYNSDFVAGTQTVFTEQFNNVALNDFPGTWNTSGSGSIVTFGNDTTKWLRMDSNAVFTPDGINSIPVNSTLEFDLKVDDNYYKISKGIDIVIAQFDNRDLDINCNEQNLKDSI